VFVVCTSCVHVLGRDIKSSVYCVTTRNVRHAIYMVKARGPNGAPLPPPGAAGRVRGVVVEHA
jgi:hypothetical protein